MPRSNRLLYLALGLAAVVTVLVGWWTFPLPSTTQQFRYDHPRNENYRPGGIECEPTALARIPDAQVRLRQTDDCQRKAEEYRQSSDDLIQQTRAANAAQAQADIASQQLWTGWLQTLGGFLTLAAAIGAAIYARDAAMHAKRSSDTSQLSLRPWVLFDTILIQTNGNGAGWEFAPMFKNFGQSPAIDVRIAMSSVTKMTRDPIVFYTPRPDPKDCQDAGIIPSNGSATASYWPLTTSQLIEQWTYIECICEYIDPHTLNLHRTEVKLRMQGVQSGDLVIPRWNVLGKTHAA